MTAILAFASTSVLKMGGYKLSHLFCYQQPTEQPTHTSLWFAAHGVGSAGRIRTVFLVRSYPGYE